MKHSKDSTHQTHSDVALHELREMMLADSTPTPPLRTEFASRVMMRVGQERKACALRRVLEDTFENILFPLYLASVCSFFFWLALGVSLHVLAAQLLERNLGILVFLILLFTGVLSLVMGLKRSNRIVLVGTASLALALLTLILRVHA
ncbi:MAG: hypothetical protein IT290_08420 [Deltaproteobacteria bacterium]|nr:hypothetical protein [Deltaproteobacteria bacterium]